MNRRNASPVYETFAVNMRAIDALDVQRADHVLDVGCDHGRSLTELAARASDGHIAGADPSMLVVATKRCHARGMS